MYPAPHRPVNAAGGAAFAVVVRRPAFGPLNRAFFPMPVQPIPLPHAADMAELWVEAWRSTGRLVLLLDFDGTLAPIVDRPELARLPERASRAMRRLAGCGGVELAVVSGRTLADVRQRVGLEEIAYAGNHGMEIQGGGFRRLHGPAAAARPALDAAAASVERRLAAVPGALIEHKGLTLSIHYRLVPDSRWSEVEAAVVAAVAGHKGLTISRAKRVFEVRPAVDWDKGRAVEFLLQRLRPPPGAPILYLGDDRTDEDAFGVLASRGQGIGVVVADPPPGDTTAVALLKDPAEVAALLDRLAELGGCQQG